MKRLKALILATTLLCSMLALPAMQTTVYAQSPTDDVCSQSRAAKSPVCRSGDTSNPVFGPSGILTRVIQILVWVIAIASVIMIIIQGLRIILSNGDPNSVASAKNGIIYALVGVVVAVLAQSIVMFVLNKL